MNYAMKILTENAKTFSERNSVVALTENEANQVNNTMITNLYKSAIDKAHIDFDDIPNSRGNITRYSGYKSLMDTIKLLKELSEKSGTRITELQTVETAIANITTFREIFEKGFALDKEFIILQYNVLVHAVVESTSIIISSYVDFVKKVDHQEFTILKGKERAGGSAINNLVIFNRIVKSGEFGKVNHAVINSGKEGFVGTETVVLSMAVAGAVLAIIPLIREIIFLTYYSRMRLSDYLSQQANLLDINKVNVEMSTLPAPKKKEVLRKQSELIRKLQKASDAVKVNKVTTERAATKEIRKENSEFTIAGVQTQSTSEDSGGFKLF